MLEKLNELDKLFESETIKPSFSKVHALLALYIFEQHPEGLGRYRLKSELKIGSGTARSLVNKLKKKLGFIKVSGQRKGHILTEKGKEFLKSLKKTIPLVKSADLDILKDVIIEYKERNAYFCLVKNAGDEVTNGMEQRDAAIKVDGLGASCLVYDGQQLNFSIGLITKSEKEKMRISDKVQTYFLNQIDNKLEKNDVIIIGLAESPEIARLAAFNSALTLITK